MCWLASRYDDKTWPKQNSDLYRAHPLRMSELWLSIMHYDYHNQIASSFLIGFDPEFESWVLACLLLATYSLYYVKMIFLLKVEREPPPQKWCCAFSLLLSMNEAYRGLRWSLWLDVMACVLLCLHLNLPGSPVSVKMSESVARHALPEKCQWFLRCSLDAGFLWNVRSHLWHLHNNLAL